MRSYCNRYCDQCFLLDFIKRRKDSLALVMMQGVVDGQVSQTTWRTYITQGTGGTGIRACVRKNETSSGGDG